MTATSSPSAASAMSWARFLAPATHIKPHEVRAVALAFGFFFFLLGSYYMLRPVRDAMGTVYGSRNLEQLFTATFFGCLVAAPIYGAFASRIKLIRFLPWV